MPGTPTVFLEDSDQSRPFRQRRYFYYLSGVDEPDCHLIYDIDRDILTLFIPTFDVHKVVWAGRGSDRIEALHKYDVDQVKWVTSLQSTILHTLKKTKGKLYILHPSQLPPNFNNNDARIDFGCLQDAINRCRVIKDSHEIQLIRKANQISTEAHRSVLNRIRSFRNEAQVEAIFKDVCITNGAKHQAYPVIAASGVNAATLHYAKNDESLIGRQLLVLDAGAEYSCYASDVTRTIPLGLPGPEWVDNWPSSEAADIHKLVLAMQTECIKRLKPGVQFRDLQVLAHAILVRGFLQLGIFQGGEEEILRQGTSLAFFPHGLGHHVGLEVHDVLGVPIWVDKSCASDPVHSIDPPQKSIATLTRFDYPHLASPELWFGPLRRFPPGPFWAVDAANHGLIEGMVITVEPGIYFSPYALETIYLPSPIHSKFINTDVLKRYMPVGGVRIEDDVLITYNGYENLTTAPKGAEMWELLSDKERHLTMTNVRLNPTCFSDCESAISRRKKTTILAPDELTPVERLQQSKSKSQISLSLSAKEKSLLTRTKNTPSELPWTEVHLELERLLNKDFTELRHDSKAGQVAKRNEARPASTVTGGTSTDICIARECSCFPVFDLHKDDQKALTFSPRKRPVEISLPIRERVRSRSPKRGKTQCIEAPSTSQKPANQSTLPRQRPISNAFETNNAMFGTCRSCGESPSKCDTVPRGEKCAHFKRPSIAHGMPSHFYSNPNLSIERSMKPLRKSSLEKQPGPAAATQALRNSAVQLNQQESDSALRDYVTPLKHLKQEGSRRVVRMHSEPCLQPLNHPTGQPVSAPFSPLCDVQTVVNQPLNPSLPVKLDEDPSWDIMGCESCSARGFKCELDHFNEIASPQHAHYPHPATTISAMPTTSKVVGGQSQEWSNHWASMWRSGAFGWQVPRPPSGPPLLPAHLVPPASNLPLASAIPSALTPQTLQPPLRSLRPPPAVPGAGPAKSFPPFPPPHMTFMPPPMLPPIPPPIATAIPPPIPPAIHPPIPPPILPPMPPPPLIPIPMATNWTNWMERMEQEYQKLMEGSLVETPALPPKPAEYKRKNF